VKKKKLFKLSQQGFTLVELLIVIVIIGILAGVVIGTLNPIQQQNRAKDGVTRSQIDKMAMSAKGLYVSSPRSSNRSPTPAEFMAGLGGATATGPSAANCVNNTMGNTAIVCTFSLAAQTLASDCSAGGYSGTAGAVRCNYMYWRNGTQFQVAARGWAKPVSVFVYSYSENANTGVVTEGFYTCPTTYTAGSVAGCTLIVS